jgi:hypothetical protein
MFFADKRFERNLNGIHTIDMTYRTIDIQEGQIWRYQGKRWEVTHETGDYAWISRKGATILVLNAPWLRKVIAKDEKETKAHLFHR